MSTSEVELRDLTDKYPSEKRTIKRLRKFIAERQAMDDGELRAYSLARLISFTKPESTWNFAHIVADLANSGVLNQFVRVTSESGVGLGDFNSYDEVPNKFHDITTDTEIEVTQDDLEVLYKIAPNV